MYGLSLWVTSPAELVSDWVPPTISKGASVFLCVSFKFQHCKGRCKMKDSNNWSNMFLVQYMFLDCMKKTMTLSILFPHRLQWYIRLPVLITCVLMFLRSLYGYSFCGDYTPKAGNEGKRRGCLDKTFSKSSDSPLELDFVTWVDLQVFEYCLGYVCIRRCWHVIPLYLTFGFIFISRLKKDLFIMDCKHNLAHLAHPCLKSYLLA